MATNNFKVYAESSTNVLDDAAYTSSDERKEGSKPNTPIVSQLINTALKGPSLVTVALLDCLAAYFTNNVGLGTSVSSLKDEFTTGLQKFVNTNLTFTLSATENAVNGDSVTMKVGNTSKSFTVKNAANARTSYNVSTQINGKAISSIFEENGTTVKNAKNAQFATYDDDGQNIRTRYVASITQTADNQLTFYSGDGTSKGVFTINNVANASSASKATGDKNGVDITTYVKSISQGSAKNSFSVATGAKTTSTITINDVEHADLADNATSATSATYATTAGEANKIKWTNIIGAPDNFITTNNIGSQSVKYATSAGSANSASTANSATSANKLATSRSFQIYDFSSTHSGSAVWFDGSNNITLKLPGQFAFYQIDFKKVDGIATTSNIRYSSTNNRVEFTTDAFIFKNASNSSRQIILSYEGSGVDVLDTKPRTIYTVNDFNNDTGVKNYTYTKDIESFSDKRKVFFKVVCKVGGRFYVCDLCALSSSYYNITAEGTWKAACNVNLYSIVLNTASGVDGSIVSIQVYTVN